MKPLALAILAVFCVAAAAPPTTRPTNHVHRIAGLFSADRDQDLRAALEKIPGVQLISLDLDHAEATFSYDPKHAFPGTKPDKLDERFDQLLRQASANTLGVKPRSTTPRDKLVRIEIPVGLLDCRACCLAVHEVLMKQDGVVQATASPRDSRAAVLIDPDTTSRDKLIAALKAREIPAGQP
jgi:copper chaperone CopZ